MKHEEQLTDDQRRAAYFIENSHAGILWADVGTGKTVSTLTALRRLFDRFDIRRVLVVGPRLVAERVWQSEVDEWAHTKGLRVSRVIGTEAQRLRALERDADIYTVSRDNVAWLESLFIRIVGTKPDGSPIRAQYRKWPFDTLVLDESQSFKAQSSKRFKSIRRLRTLAERCYLLSGSLMPNGYRDLWSQMYLVDGGVRLGRTEEAYLRRWFQKEVRDGVVTYDLRAGAAEEIDRLIADVICVMRDSQPPVDKNFIRVTLEPKELKAYREMVRNSCLALGDTQINAINAGVLWGKLLQIANGAVYDSDKTWHLVHNKKIEALVETLESLPRPIIIGYGFVHDVERIRAALSRAGIEGVGILRTGRSLDDWRAGRIRVGIMHPASAGHGLNDLYVSGAENLVWFGLTPNKEFEEQLNGRLAGGHRRTGRNICIHYLVADNTVDDDAIAMLDYKGAEALTAQIRIAQRMTKEAPHEGNNKIRRNQPDSVSRNAARG